jgi:hypothetical protein
MRLLNDSQGNLDGRVALTTDDIRCLAMALDLLQDRHPDLCSGLGGDTLLPQLDALLLDLYTQKAL